MKFISKEECEILGMGLDEELLNEILSRVYNAAIEEAIKKLPDVVSRMVRNTTATQVMTKKFFSVNKGFDKHTDIVAGVIEDIESQYPNKDYKDILSDAIPIIKQKISITENLPALSLDTPSSINLNGNGVI